MARFAAAALALAAAAVCEAGAAAAGTSRAVAVLPIEVRGAAASRAELDEWGAALRDAARLVLARDNQTGLVRLPASLPAACDVPCELRASREAGAGFALGASLSSAEGASALLLTLWSTDSGAPVGRERVARLQRAELREALGASVEKLLRRGLGVAPPPAASAPLPPKPRPVGPVTPVPAPAPIPPLAPVAAAPASPRPAAATGAPDPTVALLREVIAEVESVRGLRRKVDLKVEILDDALFDHELRAKAERDLKPALVAAERARWAAFALAPAGADPAALLLGVLDEQVAGFYDPGTQTLTVRRNVPASASAAGSDGLRLVLAHEVEHALQDQHFGFPDFAALPDDDTRLARLAVFEGDAMLTMIAFAAHRAGRPVAEALAATRSAFAAGGTNGLIASSGFSPKLLAAPAILREELIFPYTAGLELLAAAYERGGFAAADAVFRKPPRSTHEVLHPDVYFAGGPVEKVPEPAAPAGTVRVSGGRMGELGTRVALATCADAALAAETAAGWAGDAYTIVERGPQRSLGLLWNTAWSAEAGPRVATLLDLNRPCWTRQAEELASERAPWTPGPAMRVRRSDRHVALVRGLREESLDGALQQMVAKLAATPAAPTAKKPEGR